MSQSTKRRVLKRHTLGALPTLEDAGRFVDQSLRIPKHRVHFDRPEHDEETFVRGVLRGAQARLSAQPFEIEDLDLRAAPLPDPADEPEPEDEPPEPDAMTLLAEQEAQWKARLDEEVARAREEAYIRGQNDAREALEAGFQTRLDAYGADVAQLREAWTAFLADAEPRLAALAFEVASTVLDAPLPPDVRSLSERAVADVVEQLSTSAPLRITLHPVDYLRLQESGLSAQLEGMHPDLRWEPDPVLKQGEWTARTHEATVRRLEHELLSTLRHRLGLLAAAREAADAEAKAEAETEADATPPADADAFS